MLLARVAGRTTGDILLPPDNDECTLAAAEMLGRLHALGKHPFAQLPGIEERNCSFQQLTAGLAGFRAVIEQHHQPPSSVLADALDWLERSLPQLRGPKVLVHGDYGLHILLQARAGAVRNIEIVNVCAHVGPPLLLQIADQLLRVRQRYA